jgi:hypothetical protein
MIGDSLNGLSAAIGRQGKIEWVHVRHEEFDAGRAKNFCGPIGDGFCHAALLLARFTRQQVSALEHRAPSRRQRYEENIDADVEPIEQRVEEYAERKSLKTLPRLCPNGKAPSSRHCRR